MPFDDNNPSQADFSGIPSLGDVQGLQNFMNDETLRNSGVQVQDPIQGTTQGQNTDPASGTDPQVGAQGAQGNINPQPSDTVTLTREQLAAIIASRGAQVQPQAQPQSQVQPQAQRPMYSVQEQTFIQNALARGYSLEQINTFLNNYSRSTPQVDPVMAAKIQAMEDRMNRQEYEAAQTQFVNRLTEFGNKWGLSEKDLVTFGTTAYQKGINIAMGNVDLETVFRAVYPEQYAIRARRMTPTTSSQIYGGTSVPEGNRAASSKLEDAYVENFLKNKMPNQYGMLKK